MITRAATTILTILRTGGGGHYGLGWAFDKRLLEGRPIYSGIYYASALFVESLFDIRWIRLLGILGVAIACWCVFLELSRQGFDRLSSFSVAVIIGSSVPFQVTASWATVSAFPYAFSISYAAFLIAEHSLSQRSIAKYALIFTSTVCLLMAFWIYQPTALAFWAFFAIGILRKQDITSSDIRRIFVYLCITAMAVSLSFLTYKMAFVILPYETYSGRAEFIDISNIPERVERLLKAMARALVFPIVPNWYSVAWAKVLGFLPLFVVLTGLGLYLRNKPSFKKRLAITCVLPFVCHGIMFVVDQGTPTRSLMPLSVLSIFYAFFAVQGYARYITRRIRRITPSVFVNCVMGLVVCFGIALSYWNFERQLVRPNVREIDYIRSELNQYDLQNYDAIHVIQPECRGRTFGFSDYEMGYLWPSSCAHWAPKSMVLFALIDLHSDTLPLKISLSEHGNPVMLGSKTPFRTNTLVVDMEKGVRAYH